jgi:DNA primase
MEISDIKSRLIIQAVLKHYNLQADKNSMLKCPFHEDDKPSLKIYTNTNTFNCFGCGANGDVIEFIQRKEQCSKHEALKKATALCGEVLLTNNNVRQVKSQSQENHGPILSKTFTTFKNGLNNVKAVKPKEYLKQRRLDFTKLEVGYNSGQFHRRGKLSEEDMKACISAGLLIPYLGKTPNAKGTTS